MPTILATDREGTRHVVEAPEHVPLMESLRDLPFGVEAICGGVCSCATCHCYVDETWFARLPEPSEEERDLLTELRCARATSRLTCQVEAEAWMDGLRLTVAPFE